MSENIIDISNISKSFGGERQKLSVVLALIGKPL